MASVFTWSMLCCWRAAALSVRLLVPAIASVRSEGEGVRRRRGERVNTVRGWHEYKMAESKEVDEMESAEKLHFISRNLQVCVFERERMCVCMCVWCPSGINEAGHDGVHVRWPSGHAAPGTLQRLPPPPPQCGPVRHLTLHRSFCCSLSGDHWRGASQGHPVRA